MVNILKRMRKLRTLFMIRAGPGAAVLSPEVTRIHMDFARKGYDGHVGARKFWRLYLPQLKYHNPAVPMSISRTENQEGPALMTVHFTTKMLPLSTVQSTAETLSSTTPAAAPPSPTGSIATINMKHHSESEILKQLFSITKAVPMHPSQEELNQLKELEEQRKLSEKDSQRSHTVNEKRRRRDAMLAQAQSGVAAAKEV